jgi:hypothetical protein
MLGRPKVTNLDVFVTSMLFQMSKNPNFLGARCQGDPKVDLRLECIRTTDYQLI